MKVKKVRKTQSSFTIRDEISLSIRNSGQVLQIGICSVTEGNCHNPDFVFNDHVLNSNVINVDFVVERTIVDPVSDKEHHTACLSDFTKSLSKEDLLNKQIVAIVNFPKKQIAKFMSECLVMGAVKEKEVYLLHPETKVRNGSTVN